ncbi:MAG: GAF domain-containing protein, partial [bacterium]
MAYVVASERATGQFQAASLLPKLIVEHMTSGKVTCLDGALLFFDKDNRGTSDLLAESYRRGFKAHRQTLTTLEPARIGRTLGITTEGGQTVSISANELNCWLPEGSKLPKSCNALLFYIDTGSTANASLLAIKDGPLHEDERRRLEQFISACAEALITKCDYEKMQRKAEEAESLISVINAINSTMNPQQMFQLIIKKAVELIPGVDGAAIVTFDADGRSMSLKAGYGYYKRLIEEKTTDFDISERVIESGAPFLISPSNAGTESKVFQSGIKSAICVPISEDNRKIGAILLESSDMDDCFSEENIPLLQAFADGVGLAISKAQSHHLLKEKCSKLEENTQTMAVAYPQLLQSEKLAIVGELASSIAHDINNPLMTIMARTDILLSRTDPRDPTYNSIDVIEKQVERISSLVQGMLGFARMSKSEFKPQNINHVVNESILLTENYLKNSNIRLKKSLEQNLPMVLADRNKLQQVFLNLIT